jgi:hypothetical protein
MESFSNNILPNYSNNNNQDKNNYFVIPSKSSIINKILNNRNNISLKNKNSNDEQSLYTISNNTLTSQISELKKE